MNKALVIFSGGQDSTTCAAIALSQFDEVHAITFNYGQRHIVEVMAARNIAEALNFTSHEVVEIGNNILIGTSPLISTAPVGTYSSVLELPGGVEPTFIPARNLLFLTIAANRAASLGVRDIFIGVCEEDSGGYWDCRQSFIDAASIAMGEALYGEDRAITIHTPLMKLTKAESVSLAVSVLGEPFFNEIFALTHTCYQGIEGGCGSCHACLLRDRGFNTAGVSDPLWQLRKPIEIAQ